MKTLVVAAIWCLLGFALGFAIATERGIRDVRTVGKDCVDALHSLRATPTPCTRNVGQFPTVQMQTYPCPTPSPAPVCPTPTDDEIYKRLKRFTKSNPGVIRLEEKP